MEIRDRVAAGKIVNVRRVAQGPSGMDASLVEKYIGPIILHDINFAALWPGWVVNVGSIIQSAGHMPTPAGSLARHSMRP